MSDDIRDRIKRVLAGAKEREMDATEVRVLRDADAAIDRLRIKCLCKSLDIQDMRETLRDIAVKANLAIEKSAMQGQKPVKTRKSSVK